jgi:hypothetical protein
VLVDELSSDPLNLPFKRYLRGVQVDRWPHEALGLALAQPQASQDWRRLVIFRAAGSVAIGATLRETSSSRHA